MADPKTGSSPSTDPTTGTTGVPSTDPTTGTTQPIMGMPDGKKKPVMPPPEFGPFGVPGDKPKPSPKP